VILGVARGGMAAVGPPLLIKKLPTPPLCIRFVLSGLPQTEAGTLLWHLPILGTALGTLRAAQSTWTFPLYGTFPKYFRALLSCGLHKYLWLTASVEFSIWEPFLE